MFRNRSLFKMENGGKNQNEVRASNKIGLKQKSPKRRKPKRVVPETEKDDDYWEKVKTA